MSASATACSPTASGSVSAASHVHPLPCRQSGFGRLVPNLPVRIARNFRAVTAVVLSV
jgi:hypothetical protein